MKVLRFSKILHNFVKRKLKKSYNKLILVTKDGIEREIQTYSNLDISINGKNNTIKLHEPIKLNNVVVNIRGNNNVVEITNTIIHYNLNIHLIDAEDQFIKIGKSTIESLALMGVNNSCIIGDECIVAANVQIWFSDGHSVYDNKTKQIINYTNTPLIIGNHVWLGQDVRITKNAKIPNNTIVGMGAIVTKKFEEENTLLAGIPAKIVKRNVNWTGLSPDKYKKKYQNISDVI